MPGTCGRTTCLFFFKGDVPLPSRTVLASSARQHAGPSPCRKLPLLALRASSSARPLQHHRFPPGDDPLLNHQIDQSAGQFPVPGRPLQLFNLIRRKQTVNQLRRIMKQSESPAGAANLLRLFDHAMDAADAYRSAAQHPVDILRRFFVQGVRFRFHSQAPNWFLSPCTICTGGKRGLDIGPKKRL